MQARAARVGSARGRAIELPFQPGRQRRVRGLVRTPGGHGRHRFRTHPPEDLLPYFGVFANPGRVERLDCQPRGLQAAVVTTRAVPGQCLRGRDGGRQPPGWTDARTGLRLLIERGRTKLRAPCHRDQERGTADDGSRVSRHRLSVRLPVENSTTMGRAEARRHAVTWQLYRPDRRLIDWLLT